MDHRGCRTSGISLGNVSLRTRQCSLPPASIVLTGECRWTSAGIFIDLIDARAVVFAAVRTAVIDVDLASFAGVTSCTEASKLPVGKALAGGSMLTGVIEAGVDGLLAAFAVKGGRTIAGVFLCRQRSTRAVVGARRRMLQAWIALSMVMV